MEFRICCQRRRDEMLLMQTHKSQGHRKHQSIKKKAEKKLKWKQGANWKKKSCSSFVGRKDFRWKIDGSRFVQWLFRATQRDNCSGNLFAEFTNIEETRWFLLRFSYVRWLFVRYPLFSSSLSLSLSIILSFSSGLSLGSISVGNHSSNGILRASFYTWTRTTLIIIYLYIYIYLFVYKHTHKHTLSVTGENVFTIHKSNYLRTAFYWFTEAKSNRNSRLHRKHYNYY